MMADEAPADCIIIRECKVATPGRRRVEHRSFLQLKFTQIARKRSEERCDVPGTLVKP